jgi:hypothetical protein
MQTRCQKDAGTKMHKCLVGHAVWLSNTNSSKNIGLSNWNFIPSVSQKPNSGQKNIMKLIYSVLRN